jgi:transposase-like protein
MSKYSKNIVNRIADLISSDSYTIAEICRLTGIHIDTYYDWLEKKSEFSEAVKKAKEAFYEKIKAEAEKSLVKMISGYTVKEKKTLTYDTGKFDENGNPLIKVKEHTITEKHIQPNPALIIFALTNRDPEKWKNKQYTDLTSNGKELQQITGITVK